MQQKKKKKHKKSKQQKQKKNVYKSRSNLAAKISPDL
jgi:hypothetical protein